MDQIVDTGATVAEFSAEAMLRRFAERGVDVVFANAGTDFAPIIEAIARNSGGGKLPRFIIAPHENLAMAMANGYYRLAGKPAVVMVHVTVGTANTICALMNMARDHVPVMVCAGRTPVTETGHIGSRSGAIHWGQESFDQGAMLREFVKWDYELRAGQPVGALVDRALDIAMSEPRGPVYMCLPREVLADDAVPMRRDTVRPLGVTDAEPSRAAIEEAARLIGKAEFPLIITSALGRTAAAVEALSALAANHAIPVVQVNATDMSLPSDHGMCLGHSIEPSPHLQNADVVIVMNCGVPWFPRVSKPKASAKVIHIGVDPLVSRHPFREYEADLLIAGTPTAAMIMLNEALGTGNKAKLDARRKIVAALRDNMRKQRDELAAQVKDQSPIHPAWLAHCVNQTSLRNSILVNELGVGVSPARFDLLRPHSYIGSSLAGGLGSGLGTALGAKLAAPERDVIACVGDGSYMFGNPLPYHFVQRAEKLPTLTVVANNHSWLAVRMSALAVYPDGAASKANNVPLQDLNPSPAFESVAASCGVAGESVEDPGKLMDALERATRQLQEGNPVLLNVHTQSRR